MATKNAKKTVHAKRVPDSLVKAIVALVRPYIPHADDESVQQAICSIGTNDDGGSQNVEGMLTRRQAAELLCVSTRTVDRFLCDGTLKRVSLHGMVRIPRQSVKQLMAAN